MASHISPPPLSFLNVGQARTWSKGGGENNNIDLVWHQGRRSQADCQHVPNVAASGGSPPSPPPRPHQHWQLGRRWRSEIVQPFCNIVQSFCNIKWEWNREWQSCAFGHSFWALKLADSWETLNPGAFTNIGGARLSLPVLMSPPFILKRSVASLTICASPSCKKSWAQIF